MVWGYAGPPRATTHHEPQQHLPQPLLCSPRKIPTKGIVGPRQLLALATTVDPLEGVGVCGGHNNGSCLMSPVRLRGLRGSELRRQVQHKTAAAVCHRRSHSTHSLLCPHSQAPRNAVGLVSLSGRCACRRKGA